MLMRFQRLIANWRILRIEKKFGSIVAKVSVNIKSPATLWDFYEEKHPELQNFAMRVLSLTCSSSCCERNWSAFEMVYF